MSKRSTDQGELDMSDELRQRVLDAARAHPSPTRGEVRRRAALLLAAAAGGALAVFAAMGGARPDQRPISLMVGTAAGASMLAVIALVGALGRGRSMLGRSQRLLIIVALAIPPALLAWKLAYSACFPSELALGPNRLGLRCFGWTMAIGAWPLAGFLVLRQGLETRHPSTLGAAFGIAAAACGWVLVDLWCPIARTSHLLLGHLLPTGILGGLGALLGHFALPIRAVRKGTQ
jgi:hypothetical protein